MMEDMIFTAPSSSSSSCLKMQKLKTREWRRKMERKWGDKEDEMDEGMYFESERRSVFIAQKMMNGGWR
ncbi:hypothetical protein RchiOBHm_Chr2g0130441 [Rosa chinensis]|uniref:Uncharacterized protein n=1 Tax=Rosa chinensis TaxID=74649 RepID=A0A2P6RUS7_ROSCH|nr:hypothetical protein RchiOBHm_Chr2g0130441 [Rosa chinensis]